MPFDCARCANCCRTYWISLVPQEAEGIARSLKVSLKEFLRAYCWLSVELHASDEQKHPWMVSGSKLRRWFGKDFSESHYLAIPLIVLKRDLSNGSCVFLDGTNCRIYDSRPGQCQLFPLIGFSADQKIGEKDYPFCVGLNGNAFSPRVEESAQHYDRVKSHLDFVKRHGFQSAWPAWPQSGFVFLDGERVAELSEQQFLELVGER